MDKEMKTPMQKLLEELDKSLNHDKGYPSTWSYRDGIQAIRDIAEVLLEKEKEVIIDAHIEGQRVFDEHPHTQWTNDQAEIYYNKTFPEQ